MPSMGTWLFFRRWITAPRRTGAVFPSGMRLARAMAAQVDPNGADLIVELGAGTGAITRALLERGIARDRLLVVERDRRFCRLLEERYPGVAVIRGDACRLRALVAAHSGRRVGAVISSLPLLNLPPQAKSAILAESFALLAGGGPFIQYTYGPLSPVDPRLLSQMGLCGQAITRVWRNIPPARVWRYFALQAAGPGVQPLAA